MRNDFAPLLGARLLRAPLLGAAALSLCAASAAADMLQLKDGRFVDGVPMKVDGEMIVVAFKNGEVRVPLELVEEFVIDGVAPPEPTTDEGKEQRAKGLVLWKGKWVKAEVREKGFKAELEAKKKELADAKAHGEWRNRYLFQSKYFRFESTMPPELNDRYSTLMDAYFEVFKKDWGIQVPKKWGKLKVCFYPDLESFQKIGGVSGGVRAYYKFTPDPDETGRELNFYNERRDPRMTETVMFHECNHYLVDLFGEGLRYPHWIGESMAEYYGASTYDPRTKTIKVGQIQDGRLAEIRSDIESGKRMTLDDMIGKSPHYSDYYWGWSFTHFLMESPAHQKKFKQFFVDLARASDVDRKPWYGGKFGFKVVENAEVVRVFKKRMGIDSFDELQKEWYAYVDKLEATGLRGYEQAGKRAFWDGQRKYRAPRLLKAAIEKGSKDAGVFILLSRCLRMKSDQLGEALAAIEKGCAMDPLEGDCWAERGFVANLMGNKDAGKKYLALANELNPGENYIDFQSALSAADEGE